MKRRKLTILQRNRLRLHTLIFLMAGLVILTEVYFGGNGWGNSLECRRVESSQIDCIIQTVRPGVLPPQQQIVNRVQAANLEQDCRDSCTYSITLVTANGMVSLPPVPFVGGSMEQKQGVVEQMNTFINSSTMPSLDTSESEIGPQAVIIGLIMLISQAIIVHKIWRLMIVKRSTV